MVWASQSQKLLTDCRAKKMTNWRNRFSVARAVSPPLCHVPWLMSVSETSQEAAATALSLPLSLSLSLCLLLGPFSICLRRVELVDVSSFYDWLRSHLALIFGYQNCVLNSCAGREGAKGKVANVARWHGGMVAWWAGGMTVSSCGCGCCFCVFALQFDNFIAKLFWCLWPCSLVACSTLSTTPALSLSFYVCVCLRFIKSGRFANFCLHESQGN